MSDPTSSRSAIAGKPVTVFLPVVLAMALPWLAAASAGLAHAQEATNTYTSLELSPNPASTRQIVTANVEVAGIYGKSSGSTPSGSFPSGSVTVSGGGQSCVAPLTAGSGSCTMSFPVAGVYAIAADYPGDALFRESSTGEDLTVNASPAVSTASVPTLSGGLLVLLGAMLAALAVFAPRRTSR